MFDFLKRQPPSAQRGPVAATDARAPGGLFGRLRARLNRGDSFLTKDIVELLPGRAIDAAVLEELETRLITADVGVEATARVLDELRRRVARQELGDRDALLAALRAALTAILAPVAQPLDRKSTRLNSSHRP